MFKFVCAGARPGNPRPPNRDPDSRFPAESGIGDFLTGRLLPGRIGNRGFPVSRPNRESGIASPIPGKKMGIGGSDSRFPSDVRASTAVGLGIYSAASIMPVLRVSHWQAACGSYSGSKRGSMLLRAVVGPSRPVTLCLHGRGREAR